MFFKSQTKKYQRSFGETYVVANFGDWYNQSENLGRDEEYFCSLYTQILQAAVEMRKVESPIIITGYEKIWKDKVLELESIVNKYRGY